MMMKTEYEKMIAGEFYSPMDPELRRLRKKLGPSNLPLTKKQMAWNEAKS